MDTTPLPVLPASALADAPFQPADAILAPILSRGSQALLYGPPGVGKSFVALGIARAAAMGGSFLGWHAPRPHKVFYLDGGTAPAEMQRRLALFGPPPPTLRFSLAAETLGPVLDLAQADDQARLMESWGRPELVVLDDLATLAGLQSTDDRWNELQRFLILQRRFGRAVLMVHQANREGQPRGSSRREDTLDLVLALRRPADWQARDGARFEIHVEKARSLHGANLEPIAAQLRGERWQWGAARPETLVRGVALLEDGMGAEAMGRALGISRASAFRLQRKARQLGLLRPHGRRT